MKNRFSPTRASALATLGLAVLLTGCGHQSSFEPEHFALRWPDSRDDRPGSGSSPKLALNIPYILLGTNGPAKSTEAPLRDSTAVMLTLGAPPDAAAAADYRAPVANYLHSGKPLPVLLSYDFQVTADNIKFERNSVLGGEQAQQAFGLEHAGDGNYVTAASTPEGEFTKLRCGSYDHCIMEMNYRGYKLQVSNFERQWLPHWKPVRRYVQASLDSLLAK